MMLSPTRIASPQTRTSLVLPFMEVIVGMLLGGGIFASGARAESAVERPRPIVFNRDIRPILSDNCFFCHGPDASNREAGLRLDVRDEAIDVAILPGDAEASELIARILSEDTDLVMPPPSTGRALSAEQKALLRQWIDEGAEYQAHWAFVPPVRPTPPTVAGDTWRDHPVDRFLYAAMRDQGLSPQPPAAPETLLRRVYFDLTGLPPTLDQIDAFLADASPGAYERLVDALLASPRFGERMAADWLDVARYSDSYGMQVDRDRDVWPYRDWVIRAFNSGMSYDRFLTEQLAGDLLPDATPDQILATTFNRLHPQECEGGSVPEEFRAEYVADRTQTVATAFLGLTLECSRCHDHKYDPLTQIEYYQLTSFFDNIDEAGLYSFFTPSVPTPTLKLPTADQQAELDRLAAVVAEREAAVERLFRERLAERKASDANESLTGAVIPYPPTGAIKHLDFEAEAAPKGTTSVEGVVGRGLRIGGDDEVGVGVGNFNRWEPFTVSLWLRVEDVKERAVVFHRSRAWTDAASRGYELLIDEGHLQWSLIHFWPGDAISVRSAEPLGTGEWQHVAVTYDGSSRADGLQIHLNGRPAEIEIVRDHLTKNITGGGGDTIAIGARFRDRGLTDGVVDEFFVWDRQLSDLEIATLAKLAATDLATLIEEDAEAAWQRWWRHQGITADDDYRAALAALREARQAWCSYVEPIPEIMVMREMEPRRETHWLARGAYDAPVEPVERTTPAALLAWDESWPDNRLGFTQWLTHPDHPLTARVAVNRLWQTLFGRGLVSTPEDFGSQGSPPTHPELLDWLAVEFRDGGWDVKRMIRLLVTSDTYRQASAEPDPRDPENLWLSRSPRYRLPAEMLRDNALALGGLLAEEIGGPPARPYEVESSFKPVGRDKGKGLHRRSLYTYWNRTGPAPALTTLDAALRDVCRMKREVTATPLQSLVVLNNPQFVEAARGLAERLHHRHGDDHAAILGDLFRLTSGREATADELAAMKELHAKQLARFTAEPDQAARWLSVGDVSPDARIPATSLAATASVANMMLNYDGCITKR